jgi:hypothetical protein
MLLNWLRTFESSRDHARDGGGARRAGGDATGVKVHPGQYESGRDRGLDDQSFLCAYRFHLIQIL